MLNKPITTEQFIEKSKSKHGDTYDYSLSNYIGSTKKIEIICKIHGSFWQRANSHMSGTGCPKCAQYSTLEYFLNKAQQIHGDTYDYSNVIYTTAMDKIEIICSLHGSFWQRPNDHINSGHGCPICKSSKGERVIRLFLIDNNIQFSEQWRHPDCKDKIMLPFDFYLPDYDLLIEFQGEQHYKFNSLFHKDLTAFEQRQKCDTIKRLWATSHKQYLEISYQDIDNIANILIARLNLS